MFHRPGHQYLMVVTWSQLSKLELLRVRFNVVSYQYHMVDKGEPILYG